MLKNRKQIHVEWEIATRLELCTTQGFFEMFDACTNALFEKRGFGEKRYARQVRACGIPMVETSARFFVPSSFGDTVMVESESRNGETAVFAWSDKPNVPAYILRANVSLQRWYGASI